ncbi:MAG: NADPH-dependent glutamate synthase [Bacteroidales bacterium]
MNENTLETYSGRNEEWRINLRKTLKTKERTAIPRIKMPETEPLDRIKSYIEVNSGLTEEQAVTEAQRCLDCVNPTCIEGCPVNINIPGFIKSIETGNFDNAIRVLKETNALPAVCGRVCPQEIQCEAICFYHTKLKKPAIAIGHLERFAADYARKEGKAFIPEIPVKRNSKVAITGSGPSGLAAAGELAMLGYQVTVFEALHGFGGVLKYGIPEFRLPNEVVDFEINNLKKLGVNFEKNFIVGRTADFDDLREEGFSAFFVGSGAGLPMFMNIPGENFTGILSANEYLTRVNLMGANKDDHDTPVLKGRNVAVIGGGNTAMDSVRTARRLGAGKAMIIYRRSEDEMPARDEEIQHAKEEGIEFLTLISPVEYFADKNGRVNKINLQKMKLGEPDNSGRRRPVPVEGSEYLLEADLVIVSIGVSPNPLIPISLPQLKTSKWKTITVDPETMQSSIPNLFAGGDIVRGGATVILAMGDGRRAAKNIHNYLQKERQQKQASGINKREQNKK